MHVGGNWNGIWGNWSGCSGKKAVGGQIVQALQFQDKETQFYSLNVKELLEIWLEKCYQTKEVCLAAHIKTQSKANRSTGWCGLVGWVAVWKPEGRWFDSWSGHRSGLQARSPGGACAGGNWFMFLLHVDVSLPLLLTPFPSLNVNK